jgi:hypothetical protein
MRFRKGVGGSGHPRLLELMNAGPFAVVRIGDRDEDRYGRKLPVQSIIMYIKQNLR